MGMTKCAYCGKEFDLSNEENADYSEEYKGYICNECYEEHFSYCDECGEFFKYHDKMLDHNKIGVLCKKCQAKFK